MKIPGGGRCQGYLHMLLCNYEMVNSLKFFFPRLIMELISTIKDFITLKPTHALAQIKALLWILLHPNLILNKRSEIKKIRKIPDNELLTNIIFKESIVYQYFVNKKKEYSKL